MWESTRESLIKGAEWFLIRALNGLSLITSIGDDDVLVSMENEEIDM